jgi:hypothetical protein
VESSLSSGKVGATPAYGGATGTLKDGSLTVQYNLIMQLSDFDDAVYGLKQ